MDPLFEIHIDLDRCNSSGVATVLASHIRQAIADGRLPAGAKLPATRKAQAAFGISRNTLANVYERLAAEGHVISRHGSGIYVADKRRKPQAPRKECVSTLGFKLNPFWEQPEASHEMGFWSGPAEETDSQIRVDFRPAVVDPRLFPHDIFRRISARQLRVLEISPPRLRNALSNRGSHALQSAIAAYIAVTRAITCDSDHVLVTSGAQQAFDVLARSLVTPGKTLVVVEDPGYPALRVPFRAAGATVAPVGVDNEGLRVADIPGGTKIICVCPSHQFPLGTTMSPRRRLALHEFARKNAAVLIEDDYDAEFRFDGAPIDALWSEETAEHVFYVGTFSKCMFPELRLGFVVAPNWALDTITLVKSSIDWHCSSPLQHAVASFIDEGHLARHVRRLRTTYRRRRDLIVGLLEGQCGEYLDPLKCSYGMHLAAISKTSIDMKRVAQRIRSEGVAIHTLDRYFLGHRTRSGLMFGFGVTTETDIESGMRIIKRALEREQR